MIAWISAALRASIPHSVMTAHAVERRFFLRVTVHAEAHVDFMHRHDAIHRLHRSVTALAFDPGMNMRTMREAHEVRQRVHAIPLNLERRRRVVRPGPRHRRDSPAGDSVAMASDASRDRGNPRLGRPAGVGMAVLAGDFVHAGVYPMAEGNRLYDVVARRPRPLRQPDGCPAEDEGQHSKQQHYPVHAHDQACDNPKERRCATTQWLKFLTIRSLSIKQN